MLTLHPNHQRGAGHYGWLTARYSFSFASWQDPRFMGVGSLRVINEDIVQPLTGFARHSHANMEILTYVLAGAVSHEDSMGNQTVISAGECQLMSAGTGVSHSEMNRDPHQPLHLLQIWLFPDTQDTPPSYQQIRLPTDTGLTQIAAPLPDEGGMRIRQDVAIYRLKLAAGQELDLPCPRGRGYLHVIHGDIRIDNRALATGDALIAEHESVLDVSAMTDSEALWFDLI